MRLYLSILTPNTGNYVKMTRLDNEKFFKESPIMVATVEESSNSDLEEHRHIFLNIFC